MSIEYKIEDFGNFRRLHIKGFHIHHISKKKCTDCHVDLLFSLKFLKKIIDWDRKGFLKFIEVRLLADSWNKGNKKLIERFIPDLSGKRVLDFGAGLGQLGLFFFKKGAKEIILTEIDEKLLELSEIYLKDIGYGGNYKFYMIEENDKLSFIKDESIDLIVASEVFEHIYPESRKNILVNLYRKLSQGGIIIITAPNKLFPKDGHTTGLWFAAWLPTKIGAWYARTFSSRCRGWSTKFLLQQGLRQYSYFEVKKVLAPLGAEDLCSIYPLQYPLEEDHLKNPKKRIYYKTLFFFYNIMLKHVGPWEAWQRYLSLAWVKPFESIK